MLLKIRADRCFVKFQRFKVMLAGFFAGGAAGMKLGNGFVERETGNGKIFESPGRHGWDCFPRPHRCGLAFAMGAINRVVCALKSKHLQRQLIKVVRPAVKEGVDALFEVNCQGISR